MAEDSKIYALIDYEDSYVQPLLLAALKSRIPPDLLVLITSQTELPNPDARFLQWRQYEGLDFDHLFNHPSTSLANSYVIRKALIRKHYLSTTVSHWMAKHPDSALGGHVKPSVDFEIDYAEFLDDALVEAWDLKASWARNAEGGEREWWILKPGMSDRGQGIKLFSSEEELQEIFEGWDPEDSDDEEEDVDGRKDRDGGKAGGNNDIMTSHLRHFTAQPYIHPPLLLSPPHPAAGRKFHIRTYVLAVGALQLYIYKPMLALFAAETYVPPGSGNDPNADLGKHLTNTCFQTGEREGSVEAFWSLPSSSLDKEDIFAQISKTTASVFEAAARSMGIHFQPLPNAFEVFGVDFLVDAGGAAWLLEVNSFPDFAQTGSGLQGLVKGLMDGVVDVAVGGFFDLEKAEREGESKEREMVKVLDIDLGRR